DLRVDGERAADRDALLHAPGELAGVLLREALEAERREELRRDRAPARRRRAPELEAELHVLEHRAPGQEARNLEHGPDPPPVGRGHESWRISRAMTSRWISDVPSPISVSLASRKIRSTGNSVM